MEYIKLNNGVEMPALGFGVWQVFDYGVCEQAVSDALATGYRSIDTAAAYLNEEAVGRAIKKSGIRRDELFITSKVWIQDHGEENTAKAIDASLAKLGLDYLDMYMIHQPLGDYYGAWRAMEKTVKAGKIRTIGVCNFTPDRLADLCLNAEVIPAVNQIMIHPFCQQTESLRVMKEYGVQPEAWGPLAQGNDNVFENETLKSIGAQYGKTNAQVILRWHLQCGVIAIPKSVHKERIEENFAIFDFSLSEDDMLKIAGLNMPERESNGVYPADAVKYMCTQYKVHD